MNHVRKNIKASLVSVIIPTRNRQKLLLEAVDSVCQQDYKTVEVIVVDDGTSKAGYRNIASSLSIFPNVKILQTQGNEGSSVSRNLGIDHAQGDYITFLDDDDLMVKGKISGQVDLMQSHNADFVTCTRFYYVVGEYQELRGLMVDKVNLKDMWVRNRIISVSPMGTKALIKKLKFDPLLITGVDYDIWLRCLMECNNSVNYQKPAIYHRRFYDNVTETGRRWRKFKGRFMILNKIKSHMPLRWQLYHVFVSFAKLLTPDPHLLIFRFKKAFCKFWFAISQIKRVTRNKRRCKH